MVIILTSVLTWGATEVKMVPEKPPVQYDDNGDPIPEKSEEELQKEEEARLEEENKKRIEDGLEPIVPEIKDEEYDWEDIVEVEGEEGAEEKKPAEIEGGGDMEGGEGEEKPKEIKWVFKEFEVEGEEGEIVQVKRKGKKKEIVKEVKLVRAPYEEEEYTKRVPIEAWRKCKEYEDFFMNAKIDNVTVFTVCCGVPYGYAETVFNSHIRVRISITFYLDGLASKSPCPTLLWCG